jgi:hypothetical protein
MDGGGADRRTGLDGGVVLKVQGGRVSGGVTFHTDWMPSKGIGIGVNDRGDIGVATGDAKDGMKVNSPGDAKAGAGGGGKSGGNAGAPEGLNWFDENHRIKGDNKEGGTAAPAEPRSTTSARRRTSRSSSRSRRRSRRTRTPPSPWIHRPL